MLSLFNTLSQAPAGYYLEYTQSALETGHDDDSYVYLGPFETVEAATEQLNRDNMRANIIKN